MTNNLRESYGIWNTGTTLRKPSYQAGCGGEIDKINPAMVPSGLRFEWDETKNEINKKKHGVSFDTAKGVFTDPNVLEFIERIEDGEERWHAIGYVTGTLLFLTVVHTLAEKGAEVVVRIISARPADKSERRLYVKASC